MDTKTCKIAFLGMGNMGSAMAGALRQKAGFDSTRIYAYAPHYEKLEKRSKEIGFIPCRSPQQALENADVVIMACKPYQIEKLLGQIKDDLRGKALLSIALGWDLKKYQTILDPSVRIQFVMPNTPAQVGEGVMLFESDNTLEEQERKEIMNWFSKMGLVVDLPTHLMGIGGALTGCGPAFVDLMIEAYADAAVSYGIPREQAYRLTSQMILGAAKLQLETGKAPGELKDAVCSPGGSTIKGVMALEKNGYRAACIAAIQAAMDKSK
jgi:pyrroline-5-carboxylate reductase